MCRAEAKKGFELVRELPKLGTLALWHVAGMRVQDAKGADDVPAGAVHGSAGVKADVRWTGDDGELGEAGVGGGIVDDQDVVVVDQEGADGLVACLLPGQRADGGLAPDAVGVDDREGGNWDTEQLGGGEDEAVEGWLTRGVEDGAHFH